MTFDDDFLTFFDESDMDISSETEKQQIIKEMSY